MIEIPGAVWSLIVRGSFSGLKAIRERIREGLHKRALLGGLAKEKEDCLIFLKWLYPEQQDRMLNYVSELPDSEAIRQRDRFEHWLNIPFVIPKDDVLAANEIFLLLGRSGKRHNVQFTSVRDGADVWDKNIICIGGHFKSKLVMGLPSEPLAFWNDRIAGFSFPSAQRDFSVTTHDLGLILKVTHPVTRKTCLLVMGGGVEGTKAAAYYLNKNAGALGGLFRKKDFAFLVRVDVQQGVQSTEPLYFSSPPWYGKWLWGYFTWRKLRVCVEK
jgi:hypothetical protein